MYTQFFRLNQAPFSISPDPHYLFMSDRHREALAHLLYGINSGGGFVLLTGEIGTGKTTVCRCFLDQIPENCNVGYIVNPKLTVKELLVSICEEFDLGYIRQSTSESSLKSYVDALNNFLLKSHANGQNNVLIIDEAQNLSIKVLEQLRLLTNLETNDRKLLQIILLGQPELRTKLQSPELEQLAQRVIARYHLGSLSLQETSAYILHRLSIAGLTTVSPFTDKAVKHIYRLTKGIPRRINLLCDRALLGAYAENKPVIDRTIIDKAAAEIFGKKKFFLLAHPNHQMAAFSLLACAGLAAIGVAWAMHTGLISKSATPSKNTLLSQNSIAPVYAATDMAPFVSANLRDENEAYRQLALLWGLSIPAGDACKIAQENSLRCYHGTGGLAEIKQIDRPVILTLRDDSNKVYYALLTGLNNTSATLRVGSTTKTISLATLARHFHGELATFWRTPKHFREKVRHGFQGEDVNWLDQQLAKINGERAPTTRHSYNRKMVKQVQDFQNARGVPADGVVGPKTYMLINVASGISEPRLLASGVPKE